MKFIFCDNSSNQKWNDFVKNNSADFGLLQSTHWGEFAGSRNLKTHRVAVADDAGNFLAIAQIIKQPLRLGLNYFYLPRGPILADNKLTADHQVEILELLFNEIKKIAKKEKAIFLRLDPAWQDNDSLKHLLSSANFKLVGQVQPKQTLILDLEKSADELLSQMKPKTRYNINVAKKHNIEIDSGEKYFDDFWRLTQKTSGRQEIVSHSKNYYAKLLKILGQSQIAELIIAKYEGKVVVANLNIYFGQWAVYLYGASDYDYRDKMAPYLLQWESIRRAKNKNLKHYDFWGVDEIKWPGVTRFKIGFAPNQKTTNYIGAWDEVYSRFWYNMYRISVRIF